MFDIFGSLKGIVKIKPVQVRIDNLIFRLHYKVTMIALMTFSLIVTSTQYIGDPISCITEDIPAPIMNTYCWIHSTFTLPNKLTARVGTDAVHPGVGPYVHPNEDEIHLTYYQWVCFVLFLQALMFYIPRYMWKSWEGGRMKMLMFDLDRPIVPHDVKDDRKRLLVNYFVTNLHAQNLYVFRYFLCEALNFVNVVGQIFFMDFFLGGEFSTYGRDVVRFTKYDQEERVDPMAKVFPKVAKCTFRKFGPSGSVQTHDGICVLPLNIVNEKIYVFLWFWFIILSVLTGLALIFRLTVMMSSGFREYMLRMKASQAQTDHVEEVNDKCYVGDWFVLYQLGKNIDPMIYKEIIEDLAKEMDDTPREREHYA